MSAPTCTARRASRPSATAARSSSPRRRRLWSSRRCSAISASTAQGSGRAAAAPPASDRRVAERLPPAATLDAATDEPPVQATPLVGRDASCERRATSLERARLLTLTGPAGPARRGWRWSSPPTSSSSTRTGSSSSTLRTLAIPALVVPRSPRRSGCGARRPRAAADTVADGLGRQARPPGARQRRAGGRGGARP